MKSPTSPWKVVLGVAFMLGWAAVVSVWAAMSLFGTLMANDAGQASSDQHSLMIVEVFCGQILVGLAGLPGGLAFFWQTPRKLLLGLFGILFLGGVAIQVWAFTSFVQG